ncbi:allantoate amidohydrolase [Ferruginivarius sediminum]|uniref:Allantoate amidohydrolase n=2 Tax=Ferruginivarius sediminum TaxID=2661937 RepID=A0A369T5S5_9PROT|nr:allantoate amidohydrolase [Ferruginivarius sediminum]
MQRLDALAAISEDEGALTRRFATPEHRAAIELIGAWMQAAGMATHLDDAGTLVGRYEGESPDAPTLIMGSHQDTVRNGGKYDGMLGIVVPIACVQALHDAGRRLPLAIEVVAFGDEEGTRFQTTLFGSKALAGTFDMGVLARRDDDGVTVEQALRDLGLSPERIPDIARRPEDIRGFLEVHIEQGPVLEAEGLPLGIVTAIAGCSRLTVTVEGEAGHAGTVPMDRRRDALACAAEAITTIERHCRDAGDLVGTVGRLQAQPGAINVIPGRVTFTIDLRAPDDARRTTARDEITAKLNAIGNARGLCVTVEPVYEIGASRCDDGLQTALAEAITQEGGTPRHLFSGAGHDAMAMADLCPTAMLFVRCAGGISHNPRESIMAEDAAMAAKVLLRTLGSLS